VCADCWVRLRIEPARWARRQHLPLLSANSLRSQSRYVAIVVLVLVLIGDWDRRYLPHKANCS
jgi:hypothetical protein